MKQVRARHSYVTGGNSVFLTITFGNAQMGTSRLLVGPELRGLGNFVRFELRDMRGRTLSIKTTVADINNQTDNVDAGYLIEGGPAPLAFVLEAVAEVNGASVDFNVDVDFT